MNSLDFKIEDDKDLGLGAWYRGRFLYWKQTLNRSTIAMGRLQRRVDKILNNLSLFVVLVGAFSLLYWFFLNLELLLINPWQVLQIWEHKHPLILIFFISVWFALFLFYRYSEEKLSFKKIKKTTWRLGAKNSRIRYNASLLFGQRALDILDNAYLLAHRLNQSEVSVLHFFRASLSEPQVQNIFIRLGVDAEDLLTRIDRNLLGEKRVSSLKISQALREVLLTSAVDAINRGQDRVEPINTILFCYKNDKLLAEMLYDIEIDEDKITNVCEWMHINHWLIDRYRAYRHSAAFKPGGGMDRAYTAIATPTLDHFSHDVTAAAKYGQLELCVGRQAEIDAIFENLESGHNGIVLVGASGVGKSAVIHGLAQLMVEERVPSFLQDKRLVEIDVSRLVSGAQVAEAQARLLACINEVSRAGNIILYISNIENLVASAMAGGDNLDLSEVLAESLTRGRVVCLATISSQNYANSLERSALGEVMTTVGIQEPSINQAILMLESKVAWLESRHRVFIGYNAIEEAVKMSSRYIHDRFLPEKAVNLLQSAVILARKNNKKSNFCSKEHIAAAVSELTGVPVKKLTEDEGQKLLSLEHSIHQRMIGQEEAVKAVSASLRRARAAMKDSKRPIASFLFLGPTGVGKTELAKSVSQVYFGDEDYMIRLDMSEYQQADSVRKMIGDVDGTRGYLTEAVRKKPFALILLDEVEKAHPDILNLFLQLLDDGRLTDGQGRTISFSESIIIATSNIGAIYIQEEIKAGTDISIIKQELIDNQINKFMRPELVNRFDGIIVFKPLTKENIFHIAAIMLKGIKQKLLDKGIDLQADKNGVLNLAQAGYDPKFGARPLRRLLQERVEDTVANMILSGELKRRDTVVINSEAEIRVLKGKKI
jgi:ATP-dependent Clp protease ATP-binding subunit ClpC